MPSPKSPRKRPTQARAKETLDVILEATDRMASEVGVGGLQMKRIARKAGVSMGTLYQYFAGIESLLAAWEARELELRGARLLAKAAELHERAPPFEDVIREIIELAFDSTAARFESYAEKGVEDFSSPLAERLRLNEPQVVAVTMMLSSPVYAHRIRRSGETVARLIVGTVTQCVYDAGFSRKSEEERDAMKRELVIMVTLYLLGEIPAAQART